MPSTSGVGPEWELGLQVFPDTDDQRFEGIDLLDATKLVPEELAPVQPVGRMTLNRNPTNFFAETEQVAFHTGHLVRGIEVTDDPLMQARLFSYLDTQLTRLGGPNFAQIPINRPLAPVNDNLRDGAMQQAVHAGRTPYLPNSGGRRVPLPRWGVHGGYVPVPRVVDGPKTRQRSPDDEYVQATKFWKSVSEVEQDHIVDAFTFELSKVDVPAVVERMVDRLGRIDSELAGRVAFGLGLKAPDTTVEHPDVVASPALAMITPMTYPAVGRVVHILAADGCDLERVRVLTDELGAAGVTAHVIGRRKGTIIGAATDELLVHRSLLSASSAEADAVVLAGPPALGDDPIITTYLQTAARHCKAIGTWKDSAEVLATAGIPEGPGIVVSPADQPLGAELIALLSRHRSWERAGEHPTRTKGA